MGGCEHAALDDTARSFCFENMPSIWPFWARFMLLGSVFRSKKKNYIPKEGVAFLGFVSSTM